MEHDISRHQVIGPQPKPVLAELTKGVDAWVHDNIYPGTHRHEQEGQVDHIDKIPHVAEVGKAFACSLRLQVVLAVSVSPMRMETMRSLAA